MANPQGKPPAAIRALDDEILDLQFSNHSQVTNTAYMLATVDDILADRRIDDDDAPQVLSLIRHVRLENLFNHDDEERLGKARATCNQIVVLVAHLRGRLQPKREAVQADGLKRPHTQDSS